MTSFATTGTLPRTELDVYCSGSRFSGIKETAILRHPIVPGVAGTPDSPAGYASAPLKERPRPGRPARRPGLPRPGRSAQRAVRQVAVAGTRCRHPLRPDATESPPPA
ncbi:hypothetical protein FRAHR75_360061 [Frankia sp. Hr75.2]|nr:hypothetical protein FRAHR75_360061 [Frankia sp. Hr75.2]